MQFPTPRSGQRETELRLAFIDALAAAARPGKLSKVERQVINSLKSNAGIIPFRPFRLNNWAKAWHNTYAENEIKQVD